MRLEHKFVSLPRIEKVFVEELFVIVDVVQKQRM